MRPAITKYVTQEIYLKIQNLVPVVDIAIKVMQKSKSEPEINLDQIDKSLFDDVADNAINQMVVLTEKTKSLQSQLKELFAISKNEESITTLSKLSEPRMTNKRHSWKKGTALIMGDSCLSGLCQ